MHLSVALLLVCYVAMTEGWWGRYRYRSIRTIRTFRTFRTLGTFRWGKRDLNMGERMEEKMSDAFKMLDGNKDGVVDLDELKNDLHTVIKGETRSADELMKDADTNGDGEIEEDEFIAEMEPAGEAEYLSRRRYSGQRPKRWWRRLGQ